MYRYRRYGIKQIKQQSSSLLTKAQIRLYRAQAETVRELEPKRISNLSIDELIQNGTNFKIATEDLNNL